MRYKKKQVEAFRAELRQVAEKLPKNYATLLLYIFQIPKRRSYQVRHFGTVDYAVLNAMKKICSEHLIVSK